MVALAKTDVSQEKSYRLVASKFPPISLFDDVASAGDFEALWELQALTNPRLLTQAGDLNLLPKADIPFGITGCSYAVAPFTHVNPQGSRFSNGAYGVLYLADTIDTAIAEVRYHQQRYLTGVEGLKYDRLTFRGLRFSFQSTLTEATKLAPNDPIYDPNDYGPSQAFGGRLKEQGSQGLVYWSVRSPGATCWGLFSPKGVRRAIQTAHYEFIWNGQEISSVNNIRGRA